MIRPFLSVTFFLFTLFTWAQTEEESIAEKGGLNEPTNEVIPPRLATSTVTFSDKKLDSLRFPKDSISKQKKFLFEEKEEEEEVDTIATIDMYQIFQQGKAVAIIDTSLTIQKEYKNNYLRKDYFELLPFVNMGHAFNRLGHNFTEGSHLSQMGAKSKHYAFLEVEDIKYYRVPTPITELFFRTTMEQGQLSDAVISVNTSPQFNMAIAYRGMRSLGKYVNQRSNSEAFRFAMTYQTLNERYQAKVHYISQEIGNQENGGITDEEIGLFESGDPDFLERSVLDVKLRSAENTLKGKRSFLEHTYELVSSNKDSAAYWKVGHQIMNETKTYRYSDASNSEYFGSLVYNISINDENRWAILKNRIETKLSNPSLGKLNAGIEYATIDYFFEVAEGTPEEIWPTSYREAQSFLNADYVFKWRGFDLIAYFNKTITGNRLSDELSVKSKIVFSNQVSFDAKAMLINKSPDFNFSRYRSNYLNYNWNLTDLKNITITSLEASFSHPSWGSVSAHVQRLENYTFYNQFFPAVDSETGIAPDLLLVQVVQAQKPLTYLKARYSSHYTLGKFALTTTAQYQKVTSDEIQHSDGQVNILHVPEWNVRSTLSFSTDLFKKALFIQAGLTGHYFTRFYADQYNPLLGDFMRQDRTLIGDYPRIDAFVNGRIDRTRIYIKYEHANSTLTGYNYYSAPNYPYRDALLRIGIVWNFFN